MQEKRAIDLIDEDEDPKGFCCITMKEYAIDHPDELVSYSASERCYLLVGRIKPYASKMYFCPWCGSQVPKDLSGVWIDILVEEYGLKSPCNWDRDKIPPEFKTDEWWKKRGL